MNKLKNLLKRQPKLYNFLQKYYYSFRRILETNLLGTKFQEWVWKSRGKKYAQEYLAGIGQAHRQLLLEKIANYRPIDSILEIGCASGPNLVLLAEKFPKLKIRGLDINSRAVEMGNQYFKQKGIFNVELLVGKADNLKQFPDKSFELVFTSALLIHIGPDKIEKVALELKRVAKKAIILLEHHSEQADKLGFYNNPRWLRDYKKLFQPYGFKIKISRIPENIWEGDWAELGHIIEIIK